VNISETKGFILVAKAVLNEKTGIKFDYSVCENKDIIQKKGLGRVYLITVNKKIYKIGYSKDKSGIKGTLGFYQGARSGKPSIRNVGINYYIEKELKKKKSVEIYIKFSEGKRMYVDGLYKRHCVSVSPSLEFEQACKDDYSEGLEGKDRFPAWNLQERKEKWPDCIHKRHDKIRKKL